MPAEFDGKTNGIKTCAVFLFPPQFMFGVPLEQHRAWKAAIHII